MKFKVLLIFCSLFKLNCAMDTNDVFLKLRKLLIKDDYINPYIIYLSISEAAFDVLDYEYNKDPKKIAKAIIRVEEHLERDIDIKELDEFLITIKDEEFVKKVKEEYAKFKKHLQKMDALGITRLMNAVRLGDVQDAARLLPVSNLNAVSKYGLHVLHYAVGPCEESLIESKKALLEFLLYPGRRSDLHINKPSSKKGFTPLHIASAHGHLWGVEKLVQAGADRSLKTKNGQTALDLAIEYKHADIVKFLNDEIKNHYH